jgi:hypothetical protein
MSKLSKRSKKIIFPTTRSGKIIPLDFDERIFYSAIKKSGEEGLTDDEAGRLGQGYAMTTRLRILYKLRGLNLIDFERAPGGSTRYKLVKKKLVAKSKSATGERRIYCCKRHPQLVVRNAKFRDSFYETSDVETQRLIEGLPDFGLFIVRLDPEEAEAEMKAARAERDRVVEARTVRS